MQIQISSTRAARGPIPVLCLAVALAGTFALILALALGRPAEAAFPGTNGKIAFERFGDVHLADPNGTSARRIEIAGNQVNPAISPDGRKVAYEHAYGIWVMNPDGTGQRRVSDGTISSAFTDGDPAWSPDGRRIVFSRYRAGDSDLWSANLDGTGQKNLTGTPDYDEEDPAWSPAGGEIAYTRVGCEPPRGGIACVFKMGADGAAQTNLTPEDNFHQGMSSEPSWSPDGTRIAFRGAVKVPHSSGTDIWVMNADGSGKTNVTDDNGTGDHHPAFSPDGEKIAFNSSRPTGDPTAVYLVGAGGGGTPARLAASTGFDHDPDWGPLPATLGPTVTNTSDSGPGSLRQAFLDANATARADTITFDIPGTGARVITPTSSLPPLTSPATVDATTQPGYAGEPVVVLSGASAGDDASGLDLRAGNSTVRGLVVNGFARGAIQISGGEGNVVEGCYLGTDASGTRARGNYIGVAIDDSASNRIGGGEPGQGNVISGNAGYGVDVEGDFGENRIWGNLIGTDASGTAGLGNAYSGVRLGSKARNSSVAANVIAANGTGVDLFGYAASPLRNIVVRGNHIGTDRTGTRDLGNSGYGVKVVGAQYADVTSNDIAFNHASGVVVADADGARISQNAVYANGPDDPFGVGIDLGGDGVTPNDPGDADGGPNGLQNFPVLTSAETAGGTTSIEGTLDSTPDTAFGIEFFSSPEADPTGHGEGRVPLSSSSINVKTDYSGGASFSYMTEKPVPPGHVVAATATPNDQVSGTFSTSEFSRAIAVTDDVAPNTTVASGPQGLVRSASATFSFASSEPGSRFECGLDGRAYADCTSPATFSNLADGGHALRVRAVDASGDTDPTPATRSWRVDTVGPSGSVKINGGAATTGTRRVKLSLKAADPAPASGVAQVRLSNNGRSWTPWRPHAASTGWKLTLGAGSKTVFVRYRDRAGNLSAVAKDTIRYRP